MGSSYKVNGQECGMDSRLERGARGFLNILSFSSNSMLSAQVSWRFEVASSAENVLKSVTLLFESHTFPI